MFATYTDNINVPHKVHNFMRIMLKLPSNNKAVLNRATALCVIAFMLLSDHLPGLYFQVGVLHEHTGKEFAIFHTVECTSLQTPEQEQTIQKTANKCQLQHLTGSYKSNKTIFRP